MPAVFFSAAGIQPAIGRTGGTRKRHAADLEKVRTETASRVSQLDTEIQRFQSRIDAMQETLKQRENATEKAAKTPTDKPTVPTSPSTAQDLSETRELRDQLRRATAGRLAGGDPSIWKTVRALKLRPGTLRIRVAGDYRLLFEIGTGDTLQLTDFILRRDLDRWLAGGGR